MRVTPTANIRAVTADL